MRRIVVTGMGAVSPLGVGLKHNWEALLAGRSGVVGVDRFDVSDLPSRIAGFVPRGHAEHEYDPDRFFGKKTQARNDEFILFGLVAAKEALNDAGWTPETDEDKDATSVIIGSGVGGFGGIEEGRVALDARGPRAVSPFFIPSILINLAGAQVGLEYDLRGSNYSVVSACATGAEAVACAARSILLDEADVVLAGGTDASVDRLTMAGFAQARSLSTGYNNTPAEASRPFDIKRDGFVMAEGAGVLVLEEYEHAKRRGADIYAELAGYCSTSDAFHITATSPDGAGESKSLRKSLDRARINPEDVDYLNAHATSTPIGDRGELAAVRALFGQKPRLAVSSTKSATGHTLGAAGALEAIYTVMAVRNNVLPPTLNLESVESGYEDLNLVPKEAQERKVNVALSNAFGFGSTKASLVFKKM